MKKTFNIYCDESCHLEHDHKNYMFLGSTKVAYNQVKLHVGNIKNLKIKHDFYAEIKWSKVSNSKLYFYLDLVEYFFATEMTFRTIGVDKSKIRNDEFGQDFNDFYYKMYYYLLNHKINTEHNYNVYLDLKDTLGGYKVKKLEDVLNAKFGVFRKVQNIKSHESLILQLTDFLMGAISYVHNNQEKKNEAKVKIVEKIKHLSKDSLTSTNFSEKLNLFFIELR
jgi:hypothetical protein